MEYSMIAAIGSICLGGVVGWLVRYFISRLEKYTTQGLTAVVGVLFGAGVVKFLDQTPDVVWFYPIGLVAGFIVYHFTAVYFIPKDRALLGSPNNDKPEDGEDDGGEGGEGGEGGGGGGGSGGSGTGKYRGPVYAPVKLIDSP